jgi:hypothetical protein
MWSAYLNPDNGLPNVEELPSFQNSSVPSLDGNNAGHDLLMEEVVQFYFFHLTEEYFGVTELVVGTIECERG